MLSLSLSLSPFCSVSAIRYPPPNSVETLDSPHLAHVPMAVGGLSMISAANYEARKFGVRSAMPGFIAVRLCPHLTFVGHNFEKCARTESPPPLSAD